ncbi:hypothetical protein JW960_08620 [candidate division KSB1 bacterium]|nr:hypothetical protein [candidate division KSB1 bacterium]
MFNKVQKIRTFTYRPKYYQPPPEDYDEDAPRIRFHRVKSSTPLKRKSTVAMALMALVILILLIFWLKIDRSNKNDFKFEEIRIEQIP